MSKKEFIKEKEEDVKNRIVLEVLDHLRYEHTSHREYLNYYKKENSEWVSPRPNNPNSIKYRNALSRDAERIADRIIARFNFSRKGNVL